MDRTIFIKCEKHSKVSKKQVLLKNVAEVYCEDSDLANKAKEVMITHLEKSGSRKVISVLFVMAQVQKEIPGAVFQSIGETDMIVEWEQKPKMELIKIVAVSLIAFFGTAFTRTGSSSASRQSTVLSGFGSERRCADAESFG